MVTAADSFLFTEEVAADLREQEKIIRTNDTQIAETSIDFFIVGELWFCQIAVV